MNTSVIQQLFVTMWTFIKIKREKINTNNEKIHQIYDKKYTS